MRQALANHHGQRFEIHAIFARFSMKAGWRGRKTPTLLIKDLTLPCGQPLADHLWFTARPSWTNLRLKPDDRIAFTARSSPYEKGYRGRRAERRGEARTETDYRLTYPTRLRKLPPEAAKTVPKHPLNSAKIVPEIA